jgi:hypothetical protein
MTADVADRSQRDLSLRSKVNECAHPEPYSACGTAGVVVRSHSHFQRIDMEEALLIVNPVTSWTLRHQSRKETAHSANNSRLLVVSLSGTINMLGVSDQSPHFESADVHSSDDTPLVSR